MKTFGNIYFNNTLFHNSSQLFLFSFLILSTYNKFLQTPSSQRKGEITVKGEPVMPQSDQDSYQVYPFPKARRFALDAGYLGRRRHIVHGLLEIDVTEARQRIQDYKSETGERLSFTAFIINCLAEAVSGSPAVQAYRDWRGRLVIYENVNINTMVEVEKDGRKVPMPYIIQAANLKTLLQIHDELRATQAAHESTVESQFMDWFLYLPGFIRRFFYRVSTRFPQSFRKYSSSVLVTAVGMFGSGGGWGIPMPNFSLTVTLGGIAEKPGVVNGGIGIRQYLDVTLSFDHDIIDGAPAARFANHFRELVESCYGLDTSKAPAG